MVKAYTNLEQSKRLTEFLPLDSADMYFDGYGRLPQGYAYTLISPNSFEHDYPCWSLAALLDALPLEIETRKQTDGHKIYYYVEHIGKEVYLSTERHESLVDACYEMITKLHKQKLL